MGLFLKNVSKNSEKFMIKNLDKFYEQIMDFTGYYNDKYYSYNYQKKHFVIVDFNILYNNIKNKKVGIYENEDFNLIEGIVL